jgi:predicted SnoaL-like aldol condensation-catalyzing enzyme
MNRPDKLWNKLSVAEKEIGGIPNSSEDIKQAHAAAIEMYIQGNVGMIDDGKYGTMYFNRTLNDWAKFDITKRTKFDATISSGLAIMACNRHLYRPNAKVEKPSLNINISKYENKGSMSRIIKK